ncbi:MAG TPA: NAD(P)H-hydrate epimerase [Candidatus Deferrimicrobium sp.]|nr:NAD(P)H-hydrate epimerase [Candidatus Deferrimicrobium sp.]
MDTTAHRRYGALTAAQLSALDAAAVEVGVDIAQLMEVAGFQVARQGWRMIGSRPGRVHVVAGHGNNGGDALVAARHMAAWGCAVTATVHVDPRRLDGVVARQARTARRSAVDVVVSADPDDAVPPADAALVIDGLLGTGLRGPARPAQVAVIERMHGTILSIDVPSGVDADTGVALGGAVRASVTCTLTACKRGFWVPASRGWTGVLVAADIGMPREAWVRCELRAPTHVRGGGLRRVPDPD